MAEPRDHIACPEACLPRIRVTPDDVVDDRPRSAVFEQSSLDGVVIDEGAFRSGGLLDGDSNEREDFRKVEELAHALIIPSALPREP
jgi:hypothetical protein